MLIIPAIDLKDGHCVRLEQGRMESATVFSKEPGKAAAQWAGKGARRLHVVDLNGAIAGKPRNENAVKEIKRPQSGNLDVGAEADVAVLRVDRGNFGFIDSAGAMAAPAKTGKRFHIRRRPGRIDGL